MQLELTSRGKRVIPRFLVGIAADADEVFEAQDLRWQVFAEEQGAELKSPIPGLDIDEFDPFCEHLIVRDLRCNLVIGTYRILTASAAKRIGRYYSEAEFDLSGLAGRRDGLLEIGRSCVHPDYRTGTTIALLWSGLASFLMQSRHQALIGCASIPLRGNPHGGGELARKLSRRHASSDDLRVRAMRPLPNSDGPPGDTVPVPPLIKGYLRSGAVICGEPCWDPAFQTADLFIYLDCAAVDTRYARRFMTPAPVESAA